MPRGNSDIPTRALRRLRPARMARDIPMPIATAVLDRLFAIDARLVQLERSPAVAQQLDRQARALVELRAEVEKARAALIEEQRVTRSAVALYLGDPGRGVERVLGRA